MWEMAQRGEVVLGGCLVGPIHFDEPVACNGCDWSGFVINDVVYGHHDFDMRLDIAANTGVFTEALDMLTTDELNRIMIEVSLGWSWQDPRTQVRDTAEHNHVWHHMELEIAGIISRGHAVELVNEWPDVPAIDPGKE